jgi:hypothetical protein
VGGGAHALVSIRLTNTVEAAVKDSLQKYSSHQPLTYNQMFGFLFGTVYLAVGFAGFASTNGVRFASTMGGRELHFFSVNPLHNELHIAVGALLALGSFAGPAISRGVNLVVGSAYLVLALVGPFFVGTTANVLGLNLSDHLLHFATASIALVVATVVGSRDPLQNRAIAR